MFYKSFLFFKPLWKLLVDMVSKFFNTLFSVNEMDLMDSTPFDYQWIHFSIVSGLVTVLLIRQYAVGSSIASVVFEVAESCAHMGRGVCWVPPPPLWCFLPCVIQIIRLVS